jgi:DNA-binding response OmpR family regulator
MPLLVGWVDDTAIIRALAIRIVERSGHACRSFPRHVDLLDADRDTPFDVVVLQPEDPLAPRLAQQRLLAQCPPRAIALASGHSVERLRDTLGVDPAAFDRFIPKPFDAGLLVAWLDGLERANPSGPRPVMAEVIRPGHALDAPWVAVELAAAF